MISDYKVKIINFLSVTIILKKIKKIQELLLGYRYNYDRLKNECIVNKVHLKFKKKIDHEDEETRLIARTIAHYESHLELRPLSSIIFFEILSYFLFPAFILFHFFKFLPSRRAYIKKQIGGIKCVFPERWKINKELFITPDLLKEENIKTYPMTNSSLNFTDIVNIFILILKVIKYRNPYPIQLALKCAMDISKVRPVLNKNAPRFILVYWEFSCSLSFLTYILHRQNIKLYNVMHGDKHFYAKHAFFEVDKCFCWNNYYIKLFRNVHARSEFVRFENPAFRITSDEAKWLEKNKPDKIGIVAPHTSTLSDNPNELSKYIIKFSQALNNLALENNLIIRTHPHYNDDFKVFLQYLSKDITIEKPSERKARFFILESRVIIGTVSSILLEAAHLNKNVITIDTPAIETVQNYHYIYNLPNVHNTNLNSLYETIYSL